jgi:hypothetical protein
MEDHNKDSKSATPLGGSTQTGLNDGLRGNASQSASASGTPGSGAGSMGGTSAGAGGSSTTGTGAGTGSMSSAAGSSGGMGSEMSGGGMSGKSLTTDSIKESGTRLATEAKQYAGDMANRAKEKGRSMFEQQKESAVGQVSSVANAFRGTADQLQGEGQAQVARYITLAADQLESLSSRLRQKDLDSIINDAQNLARRSPGAFLVGTVVTGFLLARFLKSSSERQRDRMAMSDNDWTSGSGMESERHGAMSGDRGYAGTGVAGATGTGATTGASTNTTGSTSASSAGASGTGGTSIASSTPGTALGTKSAGTTPSSLTGTNPGGNSYDNR